MSKTDHKIEKESTQKDDKNLNPIKATLFEEDDYFEEFENNGK